MKVFAAMEFVNAVLLYHGVRPSICILILFNLYQTAIYHNPYHVQMEFQVDAEAMRHIYTDLGIVLALALLMGSRKRKYMRQHECEEVLWIIAMGYLTVIWLVYKGTCIVL